MLDILDQVDGSSEVTTKMTMVKKVPFCYHYRTGNYLKLDNLEDFGNILDYYFDYYNDHFEVKNFGKWYIVNKKYTVVYKEKLFLYPM